MDMNGFYLVLGTILQVTPHASLSMIEETEHDLYGYRYYSWWCIGSLENLEDRHINACSLSMPNVIEGAVLSEYDPVSLIVLGFPVGWQTDT